MTQSLPSNASGSDITSSASCHSMPSASASPNSYQQSFEDSFNFAALHDIEVAAGDGFAVAPDYFAPHQFGSIFDAHGQFSSSELLGMAPMVVDSKASATSEAIHQGYSLFGRHSHPIPPTSASVQFQRMLPPTPTSTRNVTSSPVSVVGTPVTQQQQQHSFSGGESGGVDGSQGQQGVNLNETLQSLTIESHKEFFDLCSKVDPDGFVLLNVDQAPHAANPSPAEQYAMLSQQQQQRSVGDMNPHNFSSAGFFPFMNSNNNNNGYTHAKSQISTPSTPVNINHRRRALTVDLPSVPCIPYPQSQHYGMEPLPTISEHHHSEHGHQQHLQQQQHNRFLDMTPPASADDITRPIADALIQMNMPYHTTQSAHYNALLQQQFMSNGHNHFAMNDFNDVPRRRRSVGSYDSANPALGPNGEHIFSCPFPECNKTFSRFYNLKSHQRTHTGERPYVCDFLGCNARFGRNHDLKRHKRVHTGDRPYQCEVCSKTFSRLDALNRHLKVSPPEH